MCSITLGGMQLRLDAADRLVDLVEERRGPVPAEDAARHLFALASVPVGMAKTLLHEVVAADDRLSWARDAVALAEAPGASTPLDRAEFVVVDLETTGLRPGEARICEIGAVRVRGLEIVETFETLVNPGVRIGPAIEALTGIRDSDVRGAPSPPLAVRKFLAFAGDAALVAHNARFDMAFLDRETVALTGRRLAAPVVDTVGLARVLLAGRLQRASLAAVSQFFGTSVDPCHRALPDAQATAEILLPLIGLAQERGAATVADLVALSATRRRRAHGKRHLAAGAPAAPGVYLFHDRNGQVLYVGRARDLRQRLRAYFQSERLRPSVEAAVGALERIEWRVCGSELEAALEELRLLRELRPAANVRSARPDRYVYLRRRGEALVCSATPGPLGPLRSRGRARLACRALDRATEEELADPAQALPRLRDRLGRLAVDLRFEDAARLRDRIAALEEVLRTVARWERLRAATLCLLTPAAGAGAGAGANAGPGALRATFVAAGRVVAQRTLPPGAGAALEVDAGLAACRRALADGVSYAPEDADELAVIATLLRKPPPELTVCRLDRDAILAACGATAAW